MNKLKSAGIGLGMLATAGAGAYAHSEYSNSQDPIADMSIKPETKPAESTAPTATTPAPAPTPAPTPAQTAAPAPAHGYTPVQESPNWNMSPAAEKALCKRLQPTVGPSLILIQDKERYWIANCVEKRITRILDACDHNYSKKVEAITAASCTSKKVKKDSTDTCQVVDVATHVDGPNGKEKIVLTASDCNEHETMPLNPTWQVNDKISDVTGEKAPFFSDDAKKLLLRKKNSSGRIVVAPGPRPAPTKNVPAKNEALDLARANEKRLDGLEPQVAKMMTYKEATSGKHLHDAVEDRSKRKD